uniref:MARVEL domain-containing protein n=1 Tax=Anopheles maculatus TaxID=74869 RepID=A0A182SLR1_9DIPT
MLSSGRHSKGQHTHLIGRTDLTLESLPANKTLSSPSATQQALAITCVILHYKSLGERDDITKLLTAGTFVGYSVILIALFAGYMLSNPINKKLDLFFSLIGCAMFIASGVLVLKEWENSWNTDTKKIAISKGSLALINGVLFFFDAIFTLRD